MLELSLVFIASFLLSVVLTPLVRQFAIRFGIVDHPDGHRKLHGRVIARAGGTAVLFSVLIVGGIAATSFDLSLLEITHITPYLALLSAMVGIWLLGLADDIWTLRGRQKLLGQTVLAAMLVLAGFKIGSLQIFGNQIELGLLAIPLSILWLLMTTNALNLIDGSDGLCSTLGAVICGALGVLASVNHNFAESVIAFAFCGALIGFLVFNFPPASIFLGDSGSLLVGMVTGALAIRCSLKGPATVAFLAPLAILSLPLLDSCMAIIRRKLTGRSIYTTDRAHMHHTLKNRGLGDRSLLVIVAVLSLITASGALAGQIFGRDWIAPLSVLVVFAMLVTTKAFGYAEVVLMMRKASQFAGSMLQPVEGIDSGRERTVHLQGTRQWESTWQSLVEFADTEGLCKVHMDLNVPWLEEGFHGTWHRLKMPDRAERWTASLPLHFSGRIAGRIDLAGPTESGDSIGVIGKTIEFVEELIPQIELVLSPPLVLPEASRPTDSESLESPQLAVPGVPTLRG